MHGRWELGLGVTLRSYIPYRYHIYIPYRYHIGPEFVGAVQTDTQIFVFFKRRYQFTSFIHHHASKVVDYCGA